MHKLQINMKTAVLLSWLFWSSLSAGCSHEKHDDREWTKEELAELEAKWGNEVRFSYRYIKMRRKY